MISSCWPLRRYKLQELVDRLDRVSRKYSILINVDQGSGERRHSVPRVACSNIRLWKLDTQKEWRNTSWRLWNARARRVLRISWSAKKTNEWVLNKAGVKRELLDTVKARKLAYYGHTMNKQGSCLEKEIMQGTMPGARRRGRPRTAWMDNINTWTGLPVEESIRMTEERDKWRKYVHGVANPRIEDG